MVLGKQEFASHHTCFRQGLNGLATADSNLFSDTLCHLCLYAIPVFFLFVHFILKVWVGATCNYKL